MRTSCIIALSLFLIICPIWVHIIRRTGLLQHDDALTRIESMSLVHGKTAIATYTSNVTRKRDLVVDRINSCWPGGRALSPLRIPDTIKLLHNSNHESDLSMCGASADILQVVAEVSCIVEANILSIYDLYANKCISNPMYVHVIVTLDLISCYRIANQSGLAWKHVRCIDERKIFGDTLTMQLIREELSKVGPTADKKGAPWFFQQFLKIEAVARGIGGLGDRVRIIDGDVLILSYSPWFLNSGHAIYDSCYSKSDGYNGIRYGHVYFSLTGKRLVGSSEMVAHSMSTTRKHVCRLKRDLAGGNSAVGINLTLWPLKSLRALCDANAITGFSEYWYIFSSTVYYFPDEVVIRYQDPKSPPHCVRVSSVKCSVYAERLIEMAQTSYPEATYVVFESHDSRKRMVSSYT